MGCHKSCPTGGVLPIGIIFELHLGSVACNISGGDVPESKDLSGHYRGWSRDVNVAGQENSADGSAGCAAHGISFAPSVFSPTGSAYE